MQHPKNFKLFYSVLQYMPDPIRRESINVGIVFHVPAMKWSDFKHIKNRNRIKSFDDEYDSEYITLMFDSLKFEFNSMLVDEYDERFLNIDSDSFLSENTKYYVNEFRFLPIECIATNSRLLDKDVHDLESTYLYYDKPKGQRTTTSEVKTLMKRQLGFYDFDFKTNKRKVFSDFCNDEIFDFTNDMYAFKAISFDKFRKKDLANELKVIYYDLESRKEDFSQLEVYIIADNSLEHFSEDNETLKIYLKFKEKIELNFDNVYIEPLSKFAERMIHNHSLKS